MTISSDEDMCMYHAKILCGLIDTTRGESRLDILPIELTAAERDAAVKAHAERFQALLAMNRRQP